MLNTKNNDIFILNYFTRGEFKEGTKTTQHALFDSSL